MGRAVLQPSSRLLNHGEMFYAPGERALARELFRAIGCRVRIIAYGPVGLDAREASSCRSVLQFGLPGARAPGAARF